MARRPVKTINITYEVLEEFPLLRDSLRCLIKRKTVLSAPVPHLNGSRCWIYTGGQASGSGYGRITTTLNEEYPGITFHGLAHRISWMVLKSDPGNLHVLHHCDHPACINPDHLYVGTQSDNTRDAIVRRNYAHPLNRSWKLTVDAIRLIRKLADEGEMLQKEIGHAFGVDSSTVSQIHTRHIYSYIED